MADYWLQGEGMCPENGVLGDIDGIAAANHMSAIHGPRLNGIRASVDTRDWARMAKSLLLYCI
jgi:hypothetical protein